MLRDEKENLVQTLRTDLGKAQAALFLDFTGLTVAEVEQLRRRFRAAEVSYRVVKNTLMKRALAGTAYESASTWLKGTPTGVALGFSDPTTPARLTMEFIKDCTHLRVKGGLLDNKVISDKDVEALSKLPSRRELQAQILGQAMGPAGRLISQIKSPAGRLVGALDSKVKKAEESGGPQG